MRDLLLDVRYALRVLWKSPAFTLVALVTLMLGIGTNVVVFGIVNAVLLHPLDVSDPQNLYQLRLKPWTSFKLLTTSYPAFEDYRQRNTTFSDMSGFYGFSDGTLRSDKVTLNVYGHAVAGNYFDFLGVQPQAGRLFHAADEHGPGSAPYIVLSDSLWRRAFNADPRVVGTTVRLYNHPFTVVGVAPARFHGTDKFDRPDYWIPILNYFEPDQLRNRTIIATTVLGRLKPGVTPQQATENLNAIATQLAKEYPKTDTGMPLRLIHPGLFGDNGDVIRGTLYSVTGLALLVLVAACANLASLFAARSADRSREMALRAALGSSRWRLVRQLLTEAAVLSLIGGAAGVLMASLMFGVLNRGSLPSFMSQWPYTALAVSGSVNVRVYLVSLVLTLASGLLFGMIPARQVWRSDPFQAMKSGRAADPLSLRRFTSRDLLLGAQIVICTLLVISSLVAVRGMVRLLHVPLGFQPQGVMLADMDLSEIESNMPPEKVKAMIDALRSVPGVTAAGTVNRVPFTGGLHGVPVFPPETTEFTLNNSVLAPYRFTVSPGYLEAAGTRLLQGRDVSWDDTAGTPYVAIVNETFARKMWGNTPAIGQRFIILDHLREVVGVMEDGKYHDMEESPQPVVSLPLSQSDQRYMTFLVRSHRAPNEMVEPLKRTLSSLEPNAPITVQRWPDVVEGALFSARAAAISLSVMGLLAAMLAVTGIFGTAAYNVSRRMKEFGIRLALGARTKHVISVAVGRPIVLLGIGSLTGLFLGVFANRILGQIVYQANPGDPIVIVGAVLTMALLGVAASAIPALRALAADPSKLLREE